MHCAAERSGSQGLAPLGSLTGSGDILGPQHLRRATLARRDHQTNMRPHPHEIKTANLPEPHPKQLCQLPFVLHV